MSDDELRSKFIECAGDKMPLSKIDSVIETCMNLDRLPEIGPLLEQLSLD
jgi:hypothetical protein